ncbi:survival protein sure-like phosphatase/nucleotidase [Spinellus fusiger]|nr:survival protein sure-like phosphatase/nucleotidase [Spinellus fusiger]
MFMYACVISGWYKETFDLVVSGPNLGRNSSTIYTLASGTVGAAMEAALCGYRAIALSFSFYSMNFEGEKSKNACEMASRVLQHLVAKNAWPDHGLFNVNVPLVDYACPVHLTRLDKTTCGSLFRPVSDPHSSSEKESSHKLLGIFSRQTPPPTPTMFKFAPAYATLPNTSPESGTDTWAIDHHYISVTPMVAAFGYPEKSVDYELETLNKL